MAVEFLSLFWSGCRILKSKVAVTLVRTLRRYVTNSGRTCPLNSDIDKEKYTRPYQDGSGFMNSREIKNIFDWFYNFYENSAENIDKFLDVMGWTHEAWI